MLQQFFAGYDGLIQSMDDNDIFQEKERMLQKYNCNTIQEVIAKLELILKEN